MKRSPTLLLLTAIILGGCALRAFALDVQPLWWDEGYSLFFATRDLGTMLERTALDIHPPLYYALLHVWLKAVGKNANAARLFSVLVGTATIPLLFTFARALFSTRVALTTALVFALAPFAIYYSQEVRMYGWVTLLALASWYLLIHQLSVTPGQVRTRALLYIGTTTAALYTQYYAAFILVAHIVVVMLHRWQDRRATTTAYRTHSPSLVHWMAAWGAIVLLYLPWVVYAGPKLYSYVTTKVAIEKYTPLDPFTFLAQHLVAFSIGHVTAWTELGWASVVMVGLVVAGLLVTGRQGTGKQATCLLTYLTVPLALGYLVNVFYPFHPIRSERLLLFVTPAFCLLVALGIHALWHRRAWYGRFALLIVATIGALSLADFYNVARYPQDDYRPLIAEMQTLAQTNDVFLAIYPWQIGYLEAYYTGVPLHIIETPSDVWIQNPAQMHHALDRLAEQRARLWLPALQTQGRLLEDALDAYLREHAYSILDQWYGTTRLELFAFADDPPLPRAPRHIVFEAASLNDTSVTREPLIAGQDIVRIRFVGNAREAVTASFRLLDANGTVWAQSDREITRALQRIGLAIPLGTPPGEYALRVSAYRTGNPQLLRVADSEQTSVLLATIEVRAPTQPNLAAVPHRTQIEFENGVRLVGYDVPPRVPPGVATPLTLFWQTTRPLARDYRVQLQVHDARGTILATTQNVPTRGIYPTTRWQSGELVRDPQTLFLRGNTPDGIYRLVAAWFDPTTNTMTRAREIGPLTVQGRARYFGAPIPTHRLNAQLGEIARLVGYDVSADAHTLRLVLYWHALASTDTSYTVFVHVTDTSGTLRAQGDQIPGAGAYPTTTWLKGEYLVDVYNIVLPRDLDVYTIRVGMYDATSGARLPAFDANGQPLGDYIRLK